jgi:hypothetical protein
MRSHYEVFGDLMFALPKDVREKALSCARTVLDCHPRQGKSEKQEEWSLQEFNDMELKRNMSVHEAYGIKDMTVLDVIKRIEWLYVNHGVNAAFMVSSLMYVIDEMFASEADPDNPQYDKEDAERRLASMEAIISEDSSENIARNAKFLIFVRNNIEKLDGRLKIGQADYKAWRDVTGDRLNTPRNFGWWDDLMERDYISERTLHDESEP